MQKNIEGKNPVWLQYGSIHLISVMFQILKEFQPQEEYGIN
jgi:hypothetical protein